MNKFIATAVIAAGMTITVTGCHTPPPQPSECGQVKPAPPQKAPIPRGVKSRKQSIEFQKSKEIVIE